MENRMYSEMLRVARERLVGRDPFEIARLANVVFDGKVFQIKCLGRKVSVSYPDYFVEPEMEEWTPIVILHYLGMASGEPVSGKLITFSQQKDGMIRGGGFDRSSEKMIQNSLGCLDKGTLIRKCTALDGIILQSNADFAAEFRFLPMIPLTLKIWFADADFPASGRLFADSSISAYLSIEDAVAVGEVFLQLFANI